MPRRTTLTLDDDVARKLEEAQKAGRPLRAVVNEALRRGLSPPQPSKGTAAFRVKPKRMGVRPEVSLDSIEQLLDRLDGPSRR